MAGWQIVIYFQPIRVVQGLNPAAILSVRGERREIKTSWY